MTWATSLIPGRRRSNSTTSGKPALALQTLLEPGERLLAGHDVLDLVGDAVILESPPHELRVGLVVLDVEDRDQRALEVVCHRHDALILLTAGSMSNKPTAEWMPGRPGLRRERR